MDFKQTDDQRMLGETLDAAVFRPILGDYGTWILVFPYGFCLLGALGTRGIIASFESSNAIDIGVVDAFGAIPAIVAGTLAGVTLLTLVMVRAATRRPIAVTLRGAA